LLFTFSWIVHWSWPRTGIAFRMAQDLGFQNDPMHWVPQDSSLITSEDVEVRRRIYWGCYISDKQISLILGRPVQLAFDSAEVDLLEFIPWELTTLFFTLKLANRVSDGPEMEHWRPAGFFDDASDIRNPSNIPYLREQIHLYRIVENMMATIFSPRTPRTQRDVSTCQAVLDNLNLELLKWRDSLPPFAKWNKWAPGVITPAVATLQ
jgi:hypothetical protein